jgi:hypothetical protein
MPSRRIPHQAALRKRGFWLRVVAIACSLLLMVSPLSRAWGQGLGLPIEDITLEQINNWLELKGKGTDLEIAPLRLDGRRLFVIAAPQVGEDSSVESLPVAQRVTAIESRLDQFIRNDFDPRLSGSDLSNPEWAADHFSPTVRCC